MDNEKEYRLLMRVSMLRNAIVEHRKAMAEYRPAEYDSLLWKVLDKDDGLAYGEWAK